LAQSVRTHKDEWGKMMEQIHEILCTILKLVAPSDTKTGLPIALLHDIAKFAEYVHNFCAKETE
jgi:hypothetical protein